MMKTVEFFSNLASQITYKVIHERSGKTRMTIQKLLTYRTQPVVRPHPAGVVILNALEELAQERADRLHKEAADIEAHLPSLRAWREALMHGKPEAMPEPQQSELEHA